jgi:competence protein ComGC
MSVDDVLRDVAILLVPMLLVLLLIVLLPDIILALPRLTMPNSVNCRRRSGRTGKTSAG